MDDERADRCASARRCAIADQVSGVFAAGEGFIEGTIAAAIVAIWLLVVAPHLARPYMVRNLRKFSLRLGADLSWIV